MSAAFQIFWTQEAERYFKLLKADQGLEKRYKAVTKAIKLLAESPRHPGLQSHEFNSLQGPRGEKVFESYAEQDTPAAYRLLWCYGPGRGQITIIAIIRHP